MRLLTCVLISVFFNAIPVPGATLLIKNANVVDPLDKTITLKSVFVRDGRIESTGPSNEEKPDVTYDAKKLWLVPGFTDMHTHSWGNDAPFEKFEVSKTEGTSQRMLYSGVTAFLDLGSSEDHIFDDRERQRSGKFNGAAIYAAGSVFVPGIRRPGSGAHAVNSEREARDEVRRFVKAKKPDVIKIIFDYRRSNGMKKNVMAAIVKAAKEAGIPSVVHIGSWLNAKHASEAGASAITHLCEDAVIPEDTLQAMKKAKV
ncbi:MAG: amidohydrolase family protein, partial [Bdellovibrionia bacterium]